MSEIAACSRGADVEPADKGFPLDADEVLLGLFGEVVTRQFDAIEVQLRGQVEKFDHGHLAAGEQVAVRVGTCSKFHR